MDKAVKQRLIGAAVLAALAMIFLPMLLRSPELEESDASRVPLTLPTAPDSQFETRVLPLPAPAVGEPAVAEPTRSDEADPNAVVTVDAESTAPREVFPDAEPAVAVDAATGQPVSPAPAAPTPAAAVIAPSPAPASAPATPAAAPAPALPATTAAGGFAVNVGSFANLENARALEGRLRAAGLPVLAEDIQLAGKPALRLRVGPYAERAAAEAARLRAQSLAGSAGTVVALDAGAARAEARPAAGTVGFAVQLGALRVEADAMALRDRVRAAGFPAFHQRVDSDGGVLFRVRVGPEADRAAAERLRDAVNARLGLGGIVVSHP